MTDAETIAELRLRLAERDAEIDRLRGLLSGPIRLEVSFAGGASDDFADPASFVWSRKAGP